MRAAGTLAFWIAALPLAAATPLSRGLEAKAAGELPRATRELAAAVAEEPGNAEAWFHYGTVLGWQDRHEEAAVALDRGLALAPHDFDLRLARARVRAWQGDYEGAARDLTRLETEFPGNEEIVVMLGRVAAWRDRPAEAADHYASVLEGNPGQIDALTGMGDLARDAGRKREALGYYRRAAAGDPSPDVMRRIDELGSETGWRWDAGLTASDFSGSEKSGWWEVTDRRQTPEFLMVTRIPTKREAEFPLVSSHFSPPNSPPYGDCFLEGEAVGGAVVSPRRHQD